MQVSFLGIPTGTLYTDHRHGLHRVSVAVHPVVHHVRHRTKVDADTQRRIEPHFVANTGSNCRHHHLQSRFEPDCQEPRRPHSQGKRSTNCKGLLPLCVSIRLTLALYSTAGSKIRTSGGRSDVNRIKW